MAQVKLGVSGVAGSFSEQAGLLYAEKNDITATLEYLIDMERVLADVANGTVDLGVFPVVNIHGGLVRMAIESMGRHHFILVDELWLDVEQCLLVRPGVKIEQIKKVVSHSQALAQCRGYLKTHFAEAGQVEWEDTAKAAQDLSQGQLDKSCAVIAPAQSARLYGLEIIASNIQDMKPNLTAFIIVKQMKAS